MIVVDGLTKRYGVYTAVDSVSFRAEPGSVTGFLGPNGAGKSTTMRMMTGLTLPSAGTSTILGRPYARLDNPGRHVGVLLDASAQHAGRTGGEVLRLDAILMGLPRRRVDAMLELVGLSGKEGDRRVGDYSLGMRQRLVLPLAWTAAFSLPALRDLAPWVDLGAATSSLYSTNDLRADDWAHLAVAATLWILVPLVLGLLRLVRREVKSS